MRADRLLSILMILQARGRVTAQQLAEELEVSVRTVYRDMDALSASGVPVYAERGPGGGCSLLDSYRTTLTGLTRDEVRALFMLSIPAPLAELGVDQELKAALLKLSAALPDSRRLDEAQVRQRIHLDSAGWSEASRAGASPAHGPAGSVGGPQAPSHLSPCHSRPRLNGWSSPTGWWPRLEPGTWSAPATARCGLCACPTW